MTEKELLETLVTKFDQLDSKIDQLLTREEMNKGFADIITAINKLSEDIQAHSEILGRHETELQVLQRKLKKYCQ